MYVHVFYAGGGEGIRSTRGRLIVYFFRVLQCVFREHRVTAEGILLFDSYPNTLLKIL